MTLTATAGLSHYQWSNGATGESTTIRSSGSYSVTGQNGAGCSSTSSLVVVTVDPLPAKPVITRSGALLIASPPAAVLAWSYNGSPLAASGDTIDASTIGEGSYSVTATNAFHCSVTSDPYAFARAGAAVVSIGSSAGANPGDAVSVPLTLESSTNLTESGATSYVATIRFNASMLAPQGLSTLGTVKGRDRLVTLTGPVSQSTGVLQSLRFIATLGTDSCTALTIDTFYFPSANVNVTREDGSFCEGGICLQDGHARLIDPMAQVSLSEPRPNPATDAIEIDYHLAEPGHTRLYLEDLLGRTALVIRDQDMLPGAYHENVHLSGIASGVYRCVLVTPSQILNQRLEVVK